VKMGNNKSKSTSLNQAISGQPRNRLFRAGIRRHFVGTGPQKAAFRLPQRGANAIPRA
jgi:hypothetical protein